MANQKIQAPKGVSEYFPDRSNLFEHVRDSLIAPAKKSGYQLIELPVFEDTDLYRRLIFCNGSIVLDKNMVALHYPHEVDP
jgi:histidyl-tRNA synthetase